MVPCSSLLTKAETIGTEPVAVLPSQSDIEILLGWCLQTWTAERANRITDGDPLVVWFATGNSQRDESPALNPTAFSR